MNSFGINVKVYSVAQILAPSHDFRYDSTMKFAILEFFQTMVKFRLRSIQDGDLFH